MDLQLRVGYYFGTMFSPRVSRQSLLALAMSTSSKPSSSLTTAAEPEQTSAGALESAQSTDPEDGDEHLRVRA